jgi:hypothetical protein
MGNDRVEVPERGPGDLEQLLADMVEVVVLEYNHAVRHLEMSSKKRGGDERREERR